jgi:hypothetical protein
VSFMFILQIKHQIKIYTIILGIAFFSSMPVGVLIHKPTLDVAFASPVAVDTLINLTNEARAQNGLPALTINPLLMTSAQEKSNDMFSKNYFAHTSPDGITPWYWFKAAGYNYVYAGENLAKNFATAEALFDAWMASSTHRANILSPNYVDIGIAIAANESVIYVTQHFGARAAAYAGATAPSKPKPESDRTGYKVATAVPAPVVQVDRVAPEIVKDFQLDRFIAQGGTLEFAITVNGDPASVVAKVGSKIVPLTIQEGKWVGRVTLHAGGNHKVIIEAKDMAGNRAEVIFGTVTVTIPDLVRPTTDTRTIVAAYWKDVATQEAAPVSLALIMIMVVGGFVGGYALETRRLANELARAVVAPAMLRS